MRFKHLESLEMFCRNKKKWNPRFREILRSINRKERRKMLEKNAIETRNHFKSTANNKESKP